MLPDGPSSSENIMTLPTDVNLRLPMVSSSPLSLSSSTSSLTPTSPPTITTTSHNNYFISNQIKIDQILPGIYLTNIGEYWTNNRLRSHGFTHIIIIDKHIQNYATMITENRIRVNATNMMSNNSNNSNSSNNSDSNISTSTTTTTTTSNRNNDNDNNNNVLNPNLTPFSSLLLSSSLSSSSSSSLSDSMINDQMKSIITTNNKFANEFEILDLNFGEESYLTTVLPNCYKAVKFIDKALQYGGAILIIDRISNQKCLTIVTAYLMYKNNLNFNDAFQRIRKIYDETAELEKFFISQLYEYEPILQVQRAQSKGHSCSRELRMTYLKRKKLHDYHHNTTIICNSSNTMICGVGGGGDGGGGGVMSASSSSSSLITHSDNYNYYNLNSTIYITNNEISQSNISNNCSSSPHDYITSGGDVNME